MRVVVGSGPVGTAVAHLLVERGEQVRLITRSGNGPDLPGLEPAMRAVRPSGR